MRAPQKCGPGATAPLAPPPTVSERNAQTYFSDSLHIIKFPGLLIALLWQTQKCHSQLPYVTPDSVESAPES